MDYNKEVEDLASHVNAINKLLRESGKVLSKASRIKLEAASKKLKEVILLFEELRDQK